MTQETETYCDQEQYLKQLINSYRWFIKNEKTEGTLLNTNNYLKNFIQEELYKCEHQLFKLRDNGLLGMMTMKKLDQQFA